jgi:hypothetical protein
MNDKNKKDLILISTIIFTFLNIIHIYFPIHLIIEDIKNKTIYGTNLEIMVLVPWIIELISIPLIIGEVAFLIICRKMKHKKTMNVLIFSTYIVQTILFNILLLF